ncbi:unnamed protein product [Sphacelaria rigidula]
MAGLLFEKDNFLVAVPGAHSEYGSLSFGDDDKNRLPSWYLMAIDIVLIHPPFVSRKRVFGILRGCLNSQQEKASDDRIKSAVMITYNRYR